MFIDKSITLLNLDLFPSSGEMIQRTLLFLTEIAAIKQWAVMSFNYMRLGSGLFKRTK